MRRKFTIIGCLLATLPCSEAEDHWAYLPPQDPMISHDAQHHPVDALLENARRKAGLESADLAPPRTWVQRATFTLTGLPASAEHIARIEVNPDDATWRTIIDELLASPAYGERWARHWMDVARYADTQGYNFDRDNRYPFAYTYRDWLIRAFNEDLPYSRFVQLQIAADHLTNRPDHPDLAALGFITVGPRSGPVETIDDRVDVVTRGFLASTVSCARCHDHKTDPITTEDYYSLYSIFENTHEPAEKPVIGKAADEAAFAAYSAELEKLRAADQAERQAIADHLRDPAALAIYLKLAWQAKRESWDIGQAGSHAFKRGRFRPKAVILWRNLLDQAEPRLAQWAREMDAADEPTRSILSTALANEWLAATDGSGLKSLAVRHDSPLAFDHHRVHEIFDTVDDQKRAERLSAMSRLDLEHPGSPPRAMNLADRENWSPARIFSRGNPASPGEPFERHWIGFLGGGVFPEGKSPRLSLAEKITDPANPMTSRVIVNRVWAWHFGAPLAEPGDFGVQQSAPPLLPLLDWLAIRFQEDGGSLKELHRILLESKTFRLAANGPEKNVAIDEANTHFWEWNRRRADFESMRDRLLSTSGALDHQRIGGRSIALENPAADERRSVYAFVDRYDLSGTFVSFDLPHPDHHSPQRAETTVPQQALYLLNGPMLLRQAAKLATDPTFKNLADDREKLRHIYQKIYQRTPTRVEMREAIDWLRSAEPADYQARLSGVWEIRHAPDNASSLDHAMPFPIFSDGIWQTGPDLATSPIRWLHAGANGGHASAGHALILRWRALGAGEVRMTGSIRRTQEGGVPLVWRISGTAEGDKTLAPEAKSDIHGPWTKVAAGDTMDFVLRAPHGDTCGGVEWDLRIHGRESASDEPMEISRLKEHFPTSATPAPTVSNGDPWADLIQMLWASNEFHFID